MRRDQDETVSFFHVRDETKTKLDSKFQARPKRDQESRCVFLRDQDKNNLLMKKMIKYWRQHIQIRTRPRRDWIQLKQTRQGRDETVWNFFIRDETTLKILYKTGTSVPLVSRPKLSSFTGLSPMISASSDSKNFWCSNRAIKEDDTGS